VNEKIKFQKKFASKNPLLKLANQGFLKAIRNLTLATRVKKILDCGCGEGIVLDHLNQNIPNLRLSGFDIDKESLKLASQLVPSAQLNTASIYTIPYSSNSFPLLICSEVLEHLENPQQALKELQRVSAKYVIISVPHEPFFRIANMARFKYLPRFGNTPGHLNHWTIRGFKKLMEEYFKIEEILYPFPWIVLLVSKKINGRR
jgi:ubiquinone/menaquinone biosynthesis C-methylase UbiE